MDSPILIRTADVSPAGELKVTAGATLVRDSDPAYEVAETRAKAGGILSAFGLAPAARLRRHRHRRAGPRRGRAARPRLAQPAALPLLAHRPGRRARRPGTGRPDRGDPARRGRLREHARPRARRLRDDLARGAPRGLRDGRLRRRRPRHRRPRPGRPARGRPPQDRVVPARGRRPARLRAAVPRGVPGPPDAVPAPRARPRPTRTSSSRAPSRRCGSTAAPSGWASTTPSSAGCPPARALPDGVRVEADEATGDVHAIVGPHYRGIQFHAESILTENGYDLLHTAVRDLLAPATD